MARVGDNLELQNQLGYLYQRCGVKIVSDSGARRDSASATSGPDSSGAGDSTRTKTATAPPPDSAKSASAQGSKAKYRVQVAAVATPGAADDAADAAEKLGYPAVIVRERGLYKVRAGTFATKEEAQAAVKRIKSGLGGSPFVVANNP
jgi:rare lipoprotein A